MMPVVLLTRRRDLERSNDSRLVFELGTARLLLTTLGGQECRTVRCDAPIPPGSRAARLAAGLLYADLSRIHDDGQADQADHAPGHTD